MSQDKNKIITTNPQKKHNTSQSQKNQQTNQSDCWIIHTQNLPMNQSSQEKLNQSTIIRPIIDLRGKASLIEKP